MEIYNFSVNCLENKISQWEIADKKILSAMGYDLIVDFQILNTERMERNVNEK